MDSGNTHSYSRIILSCKRKMKFAGKWRESERNILSNVTQTEKDTQTHLCFFYSMSSYASIHPGITAETRKVRRAMMVDRHNRQGNSQVALFMVN